MMTNQEYIFEMNKLAEFYVPRMKVLLNDIDLMDSFSNEFMEKVQELRNQVTRTQLHEIYQVPIGQLLPWEKLRCDHAVN